MTTTELAVNRDTETKTVSVLPYEYWGMGERWTYSKALAGARTIIPTGLRAATPDETAANVFLVLETGAMLGIHPMAALQLIDIIEGAATISPQGFLAVARGRGHKIRIVESGSIAGGDFRVDVTLIRADDPDDPITASWDLEDAVSAELCELVLDPSTNKYKIVSRSKNGNALNWEKYPKDMCMWRALGRLMRRGAADIMMGIGYFPEELQVVVTENGVRRDMSADEDEIIEKIRGLDDKADMANLWREHNRMVDGKVVTGDAWTKRVQAEFDAHLSTLTKDSRPPREGTPGNTGVGAIDAHAAHAPASEEISEEVDEEVRSAEYDAEVAAQQEREAVVEPEPVENPMDALRQDAARQAFNGDALQ